MKSRIVLMVLLLAALPAAAAQIGALAGGTCGTPTPVTALPFNDSGTTVGGSDTVNSVTCTTVTGMAGNGAPFTVAGPDVVYTFTTAAGNTLSIGVVPQVTYDPAIYVLTTCGTGTSCTNGADASGTGGGESINSIAYAAGQHFLYVDSHYSATDPTPSVAAKASGTYTLSVTGSLPAELVNFVLD